MTDTQQWPGGMTWRKRDAIINAGRNGTGTEFGFEATWVNRTQELQGLMAHVERIASGGSTVALFTGDAGVGKTAIQTALRAAARNADIVCMRADLTGGGYLGGAPAKVVLFYQQAVASLSTGGHPEPGSLQIILNRYLESIDEVQATVERFTTLPLGFDFLAVLRQYVAARRHEDNETELLAIRWLTGEIGKAEARKQLGTHRIIDENSYFDALKLFARFFRAIGFKGLLVSVDEVAELTNLRAPARHSNFEKILHIINDLTQNSVEGLGFFFSGTEAIIGKDRGLFSNDFIRTRHQPHRFSDGGTTDFGAPIVKLTSISPEHLVLLCEKLHAVYLSGSEITELVPRAGIELFVEQYLSGLRGKAADRTRQVVRDFIGMLDRISETHELWTDCMNGGSRV
jgi:hypothetical protein